MRGGEWVLLGILFLLRSSAAASDAQSGYETSRTFIDVEGGPGSVVWVVQLSDLHFSVFHPERAVDFSQMVGPALATIKPSLVLITGDLTGVSGLSFCGFPVILFLREAHHIRS